MNICWYEDDELSIYFDKTPELDVLFVQPWMSEDEIKSVNSKPFLCKSELKVQLIDKIEFESYIFTIQKDYRWDGASIPRFFWRLIGAKTDNRFLVPSLIHDVLCENHEYVENNRYFSTIVFERLLFVSRVHPFNRWLIKHSVDNYQKFCGW